MNLINQAKDKYHALSFREQMIVLAGILLVVLFLVYDFIYSPIQETLTSQEQTLHENAETLAWMKTVLPQVKSATTAKPIQKDALLSVLQKELATPSFKAFPYQLSQANNTDIDLRFAKVPFNQFMSWLDKLSRGYQIEVVLFEVKKTDRTGVCEVHAVLKAS